MYVGQHIGFIGGFEMFYYECNYELFNY